MFFASLFPGQKGEHTRIRGVASGWGLHAFLDLGLFLQRFQSSVDGSGTPHKAGIRIQLNDATALPVVPAPTVH